MANVIVTGGAGFIGSHIVDRLIENGDAVLVIDKVDPVDANRNEKAAYKRLDILDSSLAETFIEFKPEAVFHLAAFIDDRASVIDPATCTEINVVGTINVLEAARQSGVKRFLFASTGVTYGDKKELPLVEGTTPDPETPYGISKLIAEQYLRYYHVQFGISTLAIRIANVYGERQDGSRECGAIAIFTKRLLEGAPVFINNDGETTRDYIYVGDVAGCFMLGFAHPEITGVVNAGTGIQTSTKAVFDAVKSATGAMVDAALRPEVHDHPKRVALSPKKAEEKLGFLAKTSVKEGIEKTVNWYKMRAV